VTQPTLHAIFKGLRNSPEVNGQTALSTRLRGAKTVLVTNLSNKDKTDLGIKTEPDLKSAMNTAMADLLGKGINRPTCYVMAEASYTVPFVTEPEKSSLTV